MDSRTLSGAFPLKTPDSQDKCWTWLFVAWALSLAAILGTLFFSEVMKLPPCSLCWYQRIAMYPLFPILTVGLIFRDPKVSRYAWPFAAAGGLLAIYHNLLYYDIIPKTITPCTQGVSCTERQLEWFGVITIPLLSLVAFLLLATALFFFSKTSRELVHEN